MNFTHERDRWTYPEGKLYLGDCVRIMEEELAEDSVDLIFSSPPYSDRRLYLENGRDLGIARDTRDWVDWMVHVFRASLRVCKGLVAYVVGHGHGAYSWDGAPALLCAGLLRAGVNLLSPAWYHRVGILGSGGAKWLRADLEWVVCATRERGRFWSDNTACGEPPKYGSGGEISHHNKSGRVNGRVGKRNPGGTRDDTVITGRAKSPDLYAEIKALMQAEGISKKEAALRLGVGVACASGKVTGVEGGARFARNVYIPPEKSNPGNVVHCKVGGGQLGSNIAHEGEAPFPEKLADFFVRSFCPKGGTVLDPFMGTGTTLAVAVQEGRKFVGVDLRRSQIALQKRRLVQARLRQGWYL